MLRTKHKQNCSFESQSSYSHSVTLVSLSSHSPSSSHPHSVILCHTVLYFPIRTVSLSVTQSFTFPSTQCHSLWSHNPSASHSHRITLCHLCISKKHHSHSVTLCCHTVLIFSFTLFHSVITQSFIFPFTLFDSVITQSFIFSFTSFHSLSSHSSSSSHPHCFTLTKL